MTNCKNKGIGLYIHIPFCEKRCAYCNFYSSFLNKQLLDSYADALISDIKEWGGKLGRPITSLYFGGGTPSLLGERLGDIILSVKQSFLLERDAEITLEVNPGGNPEHILNIAKKYGVNRLSIGAQSGNNEELRLLSRTHTAEDTKNTVEIARGLGFKNISLDIMCALPDSDISSLKESLDFLTCLNPEHISVYMLKIEKNTAFFKKKDSLNLPNEDNQAEQYLYMCEYLEGKGYSHYEISNFAKENMQSRHNNIYWSCDEYLGLGASAHSFLDGKRFYYEPDINAYIGGKKPIYDDLGGSKQEYIMLTLRLSRGLVFDDYFKRFNSPIPKGIIDIAKKLEANALVRVNDTSISLTDKGMLLSNSIISLILEEL